MNSKMPEPKRYLLTYVKVDKTVGDYEISVPIDRTKDGFRTYCFNRHGIRFFKNKGVIKIREIQVIDTVSL